MIKPTVCSRRRARFRFQMSRASALVLATTELGHATCISPRRPTTAPKSSYGVLDPVAHPSNRARIFESADRARHKQDMDGIEQLGRRGGGGPPRFACRVGATTCDLSHSSCWPETRPSRLAASNTRTDSCDGAVHTPRLPSTSVRTIRSAYRPASIDTSDARANASASAAALSARFGNRSWPYHSALGVAATTRAASKKSSVMMSATGLPPCAAGSQGVLLEEWPIPSQIFIRPPCH